MGEAPYTDIDFTKVEFKDLAGDTVTLSGTLEVNYASGAVSGSLTATVTDVNQSPVTYTLTAVGSLSAVGELYSWGGRWEFAYIYCHL